MATKENFFDMLNRVHNPDYYYGRKKNEEKKTENNSDVLEENIENSDKELAEGSNEENKIKDSTKSQAEIN